MKSDEIKRVLSVGAGTRGHQIGFLCAMHGYEVCIYDQKQKALENARQRIEQLADRIIESDRLPAKEKSATFGRLTFTADATGRPDRFLAFHFHDILLTDVVDGMPHAGTSPPVVDLVRKFARRLGQTVILLERENFGYAFIATLSDLFKSALALAANRVAANAAFLQSLVDEGRLGRKMPFMVRPPAAVR